MQEENQKKVKIFNSRDARILEREIKKFKEEHDVVEVIQHSPYRAFVFYMDLPKELKLWK